MYVESELRLIQSYAQCSVPEGVDNWHSTVIVFPRLFIYSRNSIQTLIHPIPSCCHPSSPYVGVVPHRKYPSIHHQNTSAHAKNSWRVAARELCWQQRHSRSSCNAYTAWQRTDACLPQTRTGSRYWPQRRLVTASHYLRLTRHLVTKIHPRRRQLRLHRDVWATKTMILQRHSLQHQTMGLYVVPLSMQLLPPLAELSVLLYGRSRSLQQHRWFLWPLAESHRRMLRSKIEWVIKTIVCHIELTSTWCLPELSE